MPTAPPEGSSSGLPLEIKIQICQNLCGHCCGDGMSCAAQEAVVRLCRTSQAWRTAAEPFLYHIIDYQANHNNGLEDLKAVTRNIEARPELAQYIRRLFIGRDACDNPESEFRLISNAECIQYAQDSEMILSCALNLRDLHICIGNHSLSATPRPSQLKSLRLCRSDAPNELGRQQASFLLANNPGLEALDVLNCNGFDHSILSMHNRNNLKSLKTEIHDAASALGPIRRLLSLEKLLVTIDTRGLYDTDESSLFLPSLKLFTIYDLGVVDQSSLGDLLTNIGSKLDRFPKLNRIEYINPTPFQNDTWINDTRNHLVDIGIPSYFTNAGVNLDVRTLGNAILQVKIL